MPLYGEFTPPGDKSISHLVVLMSILADGEISVSSLADGEALKNSLGFFRALGGEAKGSGSCWTITGLGGKPRTNPDQLVEINCGNCNTTLNLGSGIVAGLPGRYLLSGWPRLQQCPIERLATTLRQMGATVETTGGEIPLNLRGGNLQGIEYLHNKINDQLKGAVLLAGLSAQGPTVVQEVIPTRDHTETLICILGGLITIDGPQIKVFPGRLTLPQTMHIPGDPSSAAFFLIGASLIPGSSVTAKDILLSKSRIGFLKVLSRMGASISINLEQEKPEPNGQVTVEYAGQLQATEITAEEIPTLIDEIPMLALAATTAKGTTVFRQVRELKKEKTDRLTDIKQQLGTLGARLWVEGDDLYVEGFIKSSKITGPALPEKLDCGGDYRLAMTLHMALAVTGLNLAVVGDESVAWSYPLFKSELARLYSK